MKKRTMILAVGGALLASPACAADEALEFWLNPSIGTDLDDDTSVELETAQRFRSAGDGRPDTYYARFWVKQSVAENLTLAGAVERRINDSGSNETRVMQQFSGRHGILRTRLRLEQRFTDNADRMGLRLRPRIGFSLPLSGDGRWSVGGNAELGWTIRSRNAGGQEGITGMRTQIGVDYEVSKHLTLGLTYLRDQGFVTSGPDEIGHAPLIGVEYSF